MRKRMRKSFNAFNSLANNWVNCQENERKCNYVDWLFYEVIQWLINWLLDTLTLYTNTTNDCRFLPEHFLPHHIISPHLSLNYVVFLLPCLSNPVFQSLKKNTNNLEKKKMMKENWRRKMKKIEKKSSHVFSFFQEVIWSKTTFPRPSRKGAFTIRRFSTRFSHFYCHYHCLSPLLIIFITILIFLLCLFSF